MQAMLCFYTNDDLWWWWWEYFEWIIWILKNEYLFWMNILDFKKMNICFEWLFWIFIKWIIFLNEYSGFQKMNICFEWIFWRLKKMNICFEWIFWIFQKWIIFWINILTLVCPRQKWLLPNVSNSSEIIQGSLVGPISVHFRVSIIYTGASGGLRSHILALFWNFE